MIVPNINIHTSIYIYIRTITLEPAEPIISQLVFFKLLSWTDNQHFTNALHLSSADIKPSLAMMVSKKEKNPKPCIQKKDRLMVIFSSGMRNPTYTNIKVCDIYIYCMCIYRVYYIYKKHKKKKKKKMKMNKNAKMNQNTKKKEEEEENEQEHGKEEEEEGKENEQEHEKKRN